ncbi:MAG: ATP-binding protein [Thermotogota bacterium]
MYSKDNYYFQEFKEKSNILNIRKLMFFSLIISFLSLILSTFNFYNSNLDIGLVNLGFAIFSLFISFSVKILTNRDIKSMKKLNATFMAYLFATYLWSFKDIYFNDRIMFNVFLFSIIAISISLIFNQNIKDHIVNLALATILFSLSTFIVGYEVLELITINSLLVLIVIFSSYINKNFLEILYKNYENSIIIEQKNRLINEIQDNVEYEIQNRSSSVENLYQETSRTNEKLKKTMEELKRSYSELNKKSEEHYLLFRISMKFNTPATTEEKINYSLGLLGEFTNVSRVYIFKNDYKNKTTSNTFEWTNYKVSPEIQNLQKIPLEEISEWIDILSNKGMIKSSNIKELPKNIREYLEPQNIKSILVLPIYIEDELYGFIGFDDCENYKEWEDEKIELLNIISNLIAHEFEREIQNKELKKAKTKAELSNEAKTKFLANMNHEIRTPINTIIGINSLLSQKNEISDDSKKLLNLSYEASKNLKELINSILDFSKIDQGNIELSTSSFNLKDLIDDIVEEFNMKKHENLAINYEYNTKQTIFLGDKVKIYQIINNMLNNAFNHTKEGEIKIRIDSEKYKEEKYKINFEIEDSGEGIEREKLKYIFDDFYQIEQEELSDISGVGLGLSISKKLIEIMGGEISVESKKGEGTLFQFYIFLKKGEIIRGTDKKKDKINSFEGHKVLLVEDNQVNQEIEKRILEMYGLEVDTANNGKQGFEKIEENPNKYEIVFMDISMPVMDGYEAIEKIKENIIQYPFKIIALTAFTSSLDKKKIYNFGFDEFLAKPIDENSLINLLKKYLKIAKVKNNKDKNKIDKNRDILDLFIKDIEEKIPIMKKSYNEKDLAKMHEIFHQIKNPFKYLRFENLYQESLELEKLTKKENIEKITDIYPKFEKELLEFLEENKE